MLKRKRIAVLSLIGLALIASVLAGAFAQPAEDAPKKKAKAARPDNEIVQCFPTNDIAKTAWKVRWKTQSGPGLIIEDAWFRRTPADPWIQVLGDARLAEIFVPYHSGSPRFWDVSQDFPLCTATAVDAGPHGKLLGNPPQVAQEIRDRGLAWVDAKGPRRGQVMLLRSIILASNYRYIVEFGFQDDGAITFRAGATGQNYATREFEAHMHNQLWRVNVRLDGAVHNSVYVVEHVEQEGREGKAGSIRKPFNGGKEGGIDWIAEKFTTLRVINEKRKNAQGKNMSYDLVPNRMGNARHYGDAEEACTLHDFWVTRNHPGELEYKKVPSYVENAESIMNTDVVLWHSTPCHHEPRSEDGEMRKGELHGVTAIMWTGFDLRPRDFFDRTPLYDP